MRRRSVVSIAIFTAASAALAAWLLPAGRESSPVTFAIPHPKVVWPLTPTAPETARVAALRRARVWALVDVAAADLGANPPDPAGTLSEPIVRCHYVDGPARGTTQKFDCALRDGEVVKVKYGGTTEIQAEIAGSRLLAALGFGADRMFLVPRLRCYGCVRTPFYTYWLLDKVDARTLFVHSLPADSYTDFEWTSVERHFGGIPLEAGLREGWAWFELDPIDPSSGANRAERDALRLAAMLLAHWDNKASNQRLVCLAAAPSGPAPCPQPFALINDLGSTFGPRRVALNRWRAAPIWTDRARCTVSMRQFPYGGSTFPDTAISEAGRQLITQALTALSEVQAVSLFSAARFPGDAHEWAAALRDKIHEIADGAPCPW
jgi:hypothetical protein